MKKELNKPTGFTIVELMIVLAIASLIISIVFLAVPQLQRSQRNSIRKNLASRISSEIEAYASNNQSTYPFSGLTNNYQPCANIGASGTTGTCMDWLSNYVTFDRNDPSKGSPTGVWIAWDSSSALPGIGGPGVSPGGTVGYGNLFIAVGAQCNNGTLTYGSIGSSSTKKYAIAINLEPNSIYYCLDNR